MATASETTALSTEGHYYATANVVKQTNLLVFRIAAVASVRQHADEQTGQGPKDEMYR